MRSIKYKDYTVTTQPGAMSNTYVYEIYATTKQGRKTLVHVSFSSYLSESEAIRNAKARIDGYYNKNRSRAINIAIAILLSSLLILSIIINH